ncbi:MAG: helix-turn-helix domain-containing protein [Candidatus Paceibacterota bacterium]
MTSTYIKSIKSLRLERGVSQLDMAKSLGISRASYIAIEQGKRELTVSELEKIAKILGVSFEELESGESPNYEKYKQMILAFLRQGAKIPKTKLAKLLYFADFSWFYSHLESMSGMQYRKIQYGPVTDAYFRLIDEMSDNGEISITQTEDGAMLISETRSGAKVQLADITKEEEKLIRDIEKKWKGKKTAEVVDFTHKQLPYLFARDNEIVSYGLFTQEDPDEIY